jgi:phenylalanyl-tRNA synthetase beta chain
MRVPFEWLKELVAVKDPAEQTARRLTMIGLEVEAVEGVDDDVVFEVNVTPNRPDCLNIIGIARELSAACGIGYELPKHDVIAETGELDFNVDILDKDLCNRYAGRIVRNVKIGESPDWLKKRLEKCNIRPINNVVDVTNYVLLEFGHPLHAFDLHTIKGSRIRVGTPDTIKGRGSKVKIKTLDGMEREMPGDSLLIWDAQRPVAVAGVMGGLETEVKDSTKDIFIESAYFEPTSVRRTSKALGLKTESSYRFERGTDIKMLKKALDRAAYLMKQTAGGDIYGKIDIYPKRHIPPKITVKYEKANRILGLKLSKKEMLNCLTGLGLDIEEADANTFRAKPPAYRRDLKRDADIIEEIARMHGYDRIPAELPKATIGIEGLEEQKSGRAEAKNNIKQSLLKSGFAEVINYSFMDSGELDLLGIAKDDERRRLVEIKNPLRSEDSYMRTTLVPSLIRNLIYNVSRGNRDIRIFETSRIFINPFINRGQDPGLPEERERLAIAYYREKSKALYKDETHDFYIVKGAIEAVLDDLKIYGCSFERSSEPFLHPGQSADILISGNKTGFIGALSPAVVSSLDIKTKSAIIAAEIDIDTILPYSMQVIKYRQLPKFPYIERDTAIILDISMEAGRLVDLLKSYPSDLIEDAHVFDVYQGKNIQEGKKSIAFNVRYRSQDRTLKDEEIDSLHKSLVEYILEKTEGQLRK